MTFNKVSFPYDDLMRVPHGAQAVRKPKIIRLLRKSWIGQLLMQKGNPL